MAGDVIGELVVKAVKGFVNHDEEFSVHGNPLKSFRQGSEVIVSMLLIGSLQLLWETKL